MSLFFKIETVFRTVISVRLSKNSILPNISKKDSSKKTFFLIYH